MRAARADRADERYRDVLAGVLDYRTWRTFELALDDGKTKERLTRQRYKVEGHRLLAAGQLPEEAQELAPFLAGSKPTGVVMTSLILPDPRASPGVPASGSAEEVAEGPCRTDEVGEKARMSWWDVDRELLEDALAACEPERQARDVEEQTAFLALLEAAVGGWPRMTAALSCGRLERDVLVVIEQGGQRGGQSQGFFPIRAGFPLRLLGSRPRLRTCVRVCRRRSTG